MTKILIDEAVAKDTLYALEALARGNPTFESIGYGLVAIDDLRQALADAALDKMADNARELALTYEQPHCEHDWKYIGSKRQAMWDCTKCGMYKVPDEQSAPEPDHIEDVLAMVPPPECQTEAEKTAYAFGWYKALESVREEKEPDPDELTIAYMSGAYEGKKRKPWVGLTDEERRHLRKCNQQHDAFALALEALLKEKNT